MFCHHCGQQAVDGARFCNHCGGGLVTGGVTPPPSATPTPAPGGTLSGHGLTRMVVTPAPGAGVPGTFGPGLEVGSVIHDRYRIEAFIGAGGMGMVFRVDDPRSGETVCLKVIRPELVAGSKVAERFRHEGLTTRKLRHPGIVAVHDVYVGDDICFLTMELLEGRTLRSWMTERRRAGEETSLETAAGIVGSILDGLAAAHAAGVVHRDLKPENVMLLGEPLEGDYRAKIMDFGIARSLEQESSLTLEGSPIGTRGYMAPEQEFGGGAVGPQADVYACGAILYELLCEIVPAGRWLDPTRIRSDLPRGLDELMSGALAQHPRVRTGSAAKLGRALRDALNNAQVVKVETAPAPEPKSSAAPPLVMPDWAEAIPGDPRSAEAGDHGLARAVRDRKTGIEFLLVPAGTYLRGASPGDKDAFADEKPAHEVRITKPFYLGRHPVTQAEWQRLTGESPSHFQGDRRPVECVSWNRVTEALAGTGLRLPTEAEWEYAGRAGGTEARHGVIDEVAWFFGNSGGTTHPVGEKKANAWGFHDMLGNVWEWCADWFKSDEYERCKGGVADPSGPTKGNVRVLRGGSWSHFPAWYRLSARTGRDPTLGSIVVGFRVARTP
ncbi:MAG: SUMF1/EgtB/PvdO family nonheme iron enzyme [Planctomycetes bacterium]|nr:SUMF1/EgtB/PvdO family nonheme iron enzyme [Planctomycetota bacterium]